MQQPPQQPQPQPQPQHPPPPRTHQRPPAYAADPYHYSRGDPRSGIERRGGGAPLVAVAGGGRGRGGGGGNGGPPHPVDDEADDEGVFPHYSAPPGASRRVGGGGGGGRSGGGSGSGGAPPPVWSRQQQMQQVQMHPARGGVAIGADGQVTGKSRPASDPAAAGAAAAERAGPGERPGGGGGVRPRPVVAAPDDYYDHPYYQREQEPRGDGGMVRGGGGGGRGAGGGRMHYADAGPPIGPPGGAAAAPAGRHPYPGPPPRVTHGRRERPVTGGRGGGGMGDSRSPVHVAARGPPRGHPMGPMGPGPSDRGEPLPPRYVQPVLPGINQALCEAVERIFQHREKYAGGGRVASPAGADGPKTTGGAGSDAVGIERRGMGGAGGRAASSLALDAKKATMRIIAIMESFEGRLSVVMADPRARAELDAIFPGVEEREFRALLEECIERSQVSRGSSCLRSIVFPEACALPWDVTLFSSFMRHFLVERAP